MRSIVSPGNIRGLGEFFRPLLLAVSLATLATVPAAAGGGHKSKVYVPIVPLYPVQTATVVQAPVAGYYYPTSSNAAAPVVQSPAYSYPTTAGGPQYINPGMSYAPTIYNSNGSTNGAANAPVPSVVGSRLSEGGRKDVFEDLKRSYQDTKAGESSRTALRKSLTTKARELYVEVIAKDDVDVDSLSKEENHEIDLMVDLMMRDDQSGSNSYQYGNATHQYGSANVPYSTAQPVYYYYVYPVVPVSKHSHHGR